jgi:O-antigen ligase
MQPSVSETLPNAWSDPTFARRIDIATCILALVLVVRVLLDEPASWFGWVATGTVVVFLTIIRWPYGALVVLISLSAMPVYSVEVAGWNARPEYFAALVVSLSVAVWLLARRPSVRLHKLDYWIVAYVLINFVSSAVGSPQPSLTLRWALQNCLAVVAYFLIRLLVRDLNVFRKAFWILLSVGLAESVYGILCYTSNQIFDSTVGIQAAQYFSDVAAPYGSMYEPNLFGDYTGCCAVLFLAVYLFGGRRLYHLICFFIASLAAFFSLSRASMLALILVAAYLFWKDHRQGGVQKGPRRMPILSFALACVLVAILAAGPLGDIMRERFANLYYEGLTEESTITRLIILQQAVQDIPGHWFLGTGTASFNLSFDWGKYVPAWSDQKVWIGNAPLRVLHDTGLIGLASFLGFFVAAWREGRHASKRLSRAHSMLVGLGAGVLLYGIAFQSTDGTILAFTWVHLGLFASAIILLSNRSEEQFASARHPTEGPA